VTVNLTYDDHLSRVQITADGLAGAVWATVERSTDEVSWSTVRGGSRMAVSAGQIAVDDYEFSADVTNYYRVLYPAEITFVSAGTADHDANLPVTPGLPAGIAAGDVLLELAATRASAQGTPTPPPTGYTELVNAGNVRVHGKVAGASESSPTQGFTGAGAAGMSVSAQMCAFRGAQMVLGAETSSQLNASGQDIATPAYTPASDNSVLVWVGWKQDDWTAVTQPVGVPSEIGDTATTLGDDQGITWAYQIQTTATAAGASAFTVTGGASAVSRGVVFELLADTLTQSASITPSLGGQVWLKFVARPFLNLPVEAYGEVNVTRRARNAIYQIVGRSAPVAVTDVRAGRELLLSVKTLTTEAHERLDFAVAGGDPVFVHAPPGSPVPTMYAVIGDVQDDQPVPGVHFWTLPLTEVAAPAAEIVGSTITWQGVLNQYATWQDVIDGETSWQDLLTSIGDPSDVIVD
jgi:hypothetical protein